MQYPPQPPNYPPNSPQSQQSFNEQQAYYPQQGQPIQPGMYPSQMPPPQMPIQPPPKKKKGKTLLIVGIVAAIVIVACIGTSLAVNNGSKANNGTTTNTSSPPSSSSTSQAPTTSSAPQTFKMGQTVSVGNTWQITVSSAKTDTGGQYSSVLQHPGDVFLNITISMKNISSQEQDESSALQWNLQDSTGQKYDQSIDPNAGSTLDGKVEAGMPLKGVISYEVPGNVKSFTLSFQNDIISAGQTIWDINV